MDLDRRALKIYERATNAVEPKEKEEVGFLFISIEFVWIIFLYRCLIFI